MPRLEDVPRPAEVFTVIHTTPEMNLEAASLLNGAAYAWFDRPPAREEKATLLRALCSTFGALDDDITITEHFPEPFLVRFKYPHHRANAVNRHDFDFQQLRVLVRPWRLEDNADQVTLRQHVRICVENVPLYSWTDKVAQKVIGRSCSLDYIEEACMRKEYTKALCLRAWVEHPRMVPQVN
jgi:hypothetical protein